MEDGGAGLERVAADGDRGGAPADPAEALEDADVVDVGVVFEEMRKRRAPDAAADDADFGDCGGGGGGGEKEEEGEERGGGGHGRKFCGRGHGWRLRSSRWTTLLI